MRELTDVVEGLRLVRQARRRFLRMDSIEQSMIDPMLDRMADDLADPAAPQPDPGVSAAPAGLDRPAGSDDERED